MTMETNSERETFAELQRLELLLMDPGVRRDRECVALLLADDFIEFGSSGLVWTRDSTLELLATEPATYEAPAVEDFACRLVGENVALATYRAVRMKATGERAATLRSSIWTKKSGNWKICFHQGTQIS
jgi:hypothetical protein